MSCSRTRSSPSRLMTSHKSGRERRNFSSSRRFGGQGRPTQRASASHPLPRSAGGEGRGEGRPCERQRPCRYCANGSVQAAFFFLALGAGGGVEVGSWPFRIASSSAIENLRGF